MKSYLLLALLAVISLYGIFQFTQQDQSSLIFDLWKLRYAKQYQSSEEFYRQKIFFNTLAEINAHNKRAEEGLESYTQGLNSFSDLTNEQFAEFYLMKQKPESTNFACSDTQPPSTNIPTQFDWAAKSAVNSVRKQSKCVAGYAISTVQSIEATYYLTIHEKLDLSVQQVIDCSKAYGNQGCKGGSPLHSFEYIKQKGIANETSYPYKDAEQTCSYSINQKVWELLNCVKVTPQKQLAIKAGVYKNPLAVSINSSPNGVKNYSSGIYKGTVIAPCKNKPDHWMLMVGYGQDDKKKAYWKLKNSWGSDWGQQGYFYITREGDGEGECGVQSELYYAQ